MSREIEGKKDQVFSFDYTPKVQVFKAEEAKPIIKKRKFIYIVKGGQNVKYN